MSTGVDGQIFLGESAFVIFALYTDLTRLCAQSSPSLDYKPLRMYMWKNRVDVRVAVKKCNRLRMPG